MPVNEIPTEPDIEPVEEPIAAPPEADSTHRLTPAGTPQAVRVRAGRYGELDTHELVQLLDTIDSEAQAARFRESIYISVFVWIVVAWFLFYGPRLLWHQPQLISPADILKNRELTELTDPTLHLPPAPRPAIKPAIDNKTMEHLKTEAARRPTPPAPQPKLPNAPTPAPPTTATNTPPPPPAPTPQPRTPVANIPDAPAVQPTRPNFGSTPSASQAMKNALDAPRGGSGGDFSSRSSRSGRGSSPLNLGGAEVLSDMQGVDFNPYLRRILADIYRNWLPLIPEEVQPPLSKEGQAYIRFTILPDGTIGPMTLDGSTHDQAINRSCWGSITTEGQFPPLPAQFHGPNLELRIHYIVSHNPQE